MTLRNIELSPRGGSLCRPYSIWEYLYYFQICSYWFSGIQYGTSVFHFYKVRYKPVEYIIKDIIHEFCIIITGWIVFDLFICMYSNKCVGFVYSIKNIFSTVEFYICVFLCSKGIELILQILVDAQVIVIYCMLIILIWWTKWGSKKKEEKKKKLFRKEYSTFCVLPRSYQIIKQQCSNISCLFIQYEKILMVWVCITWNRRPNVIRTQTIHIFRTSWHDFSIQNALLFEIHMEITLIVCKCPSLYYPTGAPYHFTQL